MPMHITASIIKNDTVDLVFMCSRLVCFGASTLPKEAAYTSVELYEPQLVQRIVRLWI